jgi:hypothetical protein
MSKFSKNIKTITTLLGTGVITVPTLVACGATSRVDLSSINFYGDSLSLVINAADPTHVTMTEIQNGLNSNEELINCVKSQIQTKNPA